jgi:hypothetical protein
MDFRRCAGVTREAIKGVNGHIRHQKGLPQRHTLHRVGNENRSLPQRFSD